MATPSTDPERTQVIAEVFAEVLAAAFGELMAADVAAFRRKFRKMAASPPRFLPGLGGAVHLGPAAPRREPRPARARQDAQRRGDHPTRRGVRGRLPRPDAGARRGPGRGVVGAFERYLATVPPNRRTRPVSLTVKDVVARRGIGIGSAGLPSYNLLVEGQAQALDNDVVLYMKQGQVPAVSRFVSDERIRDFFGTSGASHGAVAARAAGAQRHLAGPHGARRRRPARRRSFAVRAGPGLVGGERARA